MWDRVMGNLIFKPISQKMQPPICSAITSASYTTDSASMSFMYVNLKILKTLCNLRVYE